MKNDIETFISLKYEILDHDTPVTERRSAVYASYPIEVKYNWHQRCRDYNSGYISVEVHREDWIHYKKFLIEELYDWELKQLGSKQ